MLNDVVFVMIGDSIQLYCVGAALSMSCIWINTNTLSFGTQQKLEQ